MPERLGPYRILGDLGRGGMGRVHLAVTEEPAANLEVGTRVALKVIHPHLLETPGFFKRFLREAQIGQSVAHENVVRTYDCDQLVLRGVPYSFLVMEYVEGQTLRALMSELETVPESLCRHIGREVAKGLEAVHSTGFVHRDLKPENVLITPDHVVKVMDLGVARLQDEAIRLSQTGSFVGSLHYAAPEQFRGGGEDLDGRADLHALGTMLYELATGTHPFLDEDTRVVLRRILEERPRPCGELNPQLSPFYEEVVHALLAKDREERFASAAVLRGVLSDGEESAWWRDRAIALRKRTRRPLRRMRIPRETAVYGRDAELTTLRDHYEQVRSGEGRVVLLEGEAGVGKSRLVDEFANRLHEEGEDLNLLVGAYPVGGAGTAAGAFASAFRVHFGEAGLETSLGTCLEETPLLIPAFAALLRGEPAPAGQETLRRDAIQTLMVRTTRALSLERPTVLVVEDLHLAPEEGLALFASIALASAEHRILLIGTTRRGLSPHWTAGLERLPHVSRVELGRLGARDLTLLLGDAFHSERLAEQLAGSVALKSDGNPFFVFEIIRGLREARAITERPDGSWATTGPIPKLPTPSTVVDLVLARVADLAAPDRELLEVAACCGFEFDPLVAAEAAGMSRVPALKRLGQIEKKHRLVRSRGNRMVFDHHQVREFLYERTLLPLREAYHGAIADTLEARARSAECPPEDLGGATAVEICEHAVAAADAPRTLRYLDPALEHLSASYENDRALALAGRALALDGCLTGEPRARVLHLTAIHLDLQGLRDEQQAALEEAATLAEACGATGLRIAVHRALGWRAFAMADYATAREELATSLGLAEASDDPQGQLGALSMLGHVNQRLGRLEEARGHYERSLDLAQRSGDRRGEAQATGSLGNISFLTGRVEEAQALYEAYLALAREEGARADEAIAIGNLGTLLRFGGRLADALVVADRRLLLAREMGDRRGEAIARSNRGALLLLVGAHGEAGTEFEKAAEIAREVGGRREEGNARHGLAAVAESRGDWEEAAVICEEVLATRREQGDDAGIAEILISRGRLSLLREDRDEAAAYFEEALGLAAEHASTLQRVQAAAHLAALGRGDPREAESILAAHETEVGLTVRMTAHFLLWRATRGGAHLAEAKRLLDHLVLHAPADRRESMFANVEQHRDIEAAWAEHGTGGG